VAYGKEEIKQTNKQKILAEMSTTVDLCGAYIWSAYKNKSAVSFEWFCKQPGVLDRFNELPHWRFFQDDSSIDYTSFDRVE